MTSIQGKTVRSKRVQPCSHSDGILGSGIRQDIQINSVIYVRLCLFIIADTTNEHTHILQDLKIDDIFVTPSDYLCTGTERMAANPIVTVLKGTR